MGRTTSTEPRMRVRSHGPGSVSGWPSPIQAVHHVDSTARAAEAILGGPPRGALARCPDTASRDAGRNSGGTSIVLTGDLATPSRVRVDWERRLAVVPAGVRLADLIPRLLRDGWFPPASPTQLPHTVGACIATDARGSARGSLGGFSDLVAHLELIDGTGSCRALAPNGPTSRDFWATAGGLGLTGLVTSAKVQVRPVTSAWLTARSRKCGNLDALLDTILQEASGPGSASYVTARIDACATGSATGRGVVVASDHAPATALPSARQAHALDFEPADETRSPLAGWRRIAAGLGFRPAAQAWFHAAPHETSEQLIPLATALFRPLRAPARTGNRMAPESIEYEFSVPEAAVGLIGRFLVDVAHRGGVVTEATVRLCDSENRSALASTVRRGWLARFDVSATPEVGAVLDAIDEEIASADGVVRLASDRRMRPDLVQAMYPGLDEWRATRAALDPDRRLQSDLARRLGL